MRLRFLVNSLSGVMATVTYTVVSFILAPVVLGHLGDRDYGIWNILLALCGYLGLLELGISPAVVRFVAMADGAGDPNKASRIVTSSVGILSVFGALAFICMALLSLDPALVLNLGGPAPRYLTITFLIVGVNVLLTIPGAALTGYFYGTQRHAVLNLLQVVLSVANAFVVYLALTRLDGPGIVWVALATLGVTIFRFTVLTLVLVFGDDALRIQRKYFAWPVVKELYAFGARSVVLLAAGRLRLQSLPLILAQTAGVHRVVFFAIPSRLVDSVWSLGMALGSPLTPYLSHLYGGGDSDAARRAWLGVARGLQFATVGLAIGILGLGVPFISRWMGPQYATEGQWAVLFLGLGALFESLQAGAGAVLVSRAEHGALAKVALAVAVGVIITAIPLTLMFGVSGAGLTMMLGNLALSIFTIRLTCSRTSLPMLDYFKETVARLTIPILGLTFALVALRALQYPVTYGRIFGYAGLAGGFYAVLAFRFSLSAGERAEIAAVLRRLASRVRAGRRPPSGP